MCWLEASAENELSELDECTAAERLRQFRAAQADFVQPSFETISAFGANAAIIHYKPEPHSAARIDKVSQAFSHC